MAAPPPMFLDLFNDATHWDEPAPDYDALILLLGGVASTAAGALAGHSIHASVPPVVANIVAGLPTAVIAHAKMELPGAG